MDITVREDRLFASWREKYDAFVVDGAPSPAVFTNSARRTVIVLKDVNAPDRREVFDLRRQLATAPHPWWRTVATWCAGISRLTEDLSWAELRDVPTKECLEPFAFMQLKKSAGGGSVSESTLYEHARRDATEIREQFSIYQPHIIIGAGVGPILAKLLGGAHWSYTRRGVRYMEISLNGEQTTYLIDYMHPSARAARNIVLYGLLDAYREVVELHFHAEE